MGAAARSGSGCAGGGSIAETALATASTASSLRQLVARVSRSAPPSGKAGEGAVEALDGARGGAAPAVDGLPRIPDRQHRVTGVAAEERLEHAQLADAGVLVLVEQDDLPARPFPAADLGRGDRDPRRVGDLVGVVDGPGRPLARLERLDQRQQRHAGPLAGEHLLDRRPYGPFFLRRVGVAGDLRLQPGRPRAQRLRADVVLAELGRQREHVLDRGEQREGDVVHVAGVGRHHGGGLPPAHGRAQDARAGFDADPQPVLGHERRRVAVIGGDRGLGDGQPVAQLRLGLGVTGERAEPQPHALVELAGRLAGEGEPRIASGSTSRLATSHETRAAIVSVLPEPAPATTTRGRSCGAATTRACSAEGA